MARVKEAEKVTDLGTGVTGKLGLKGQSVLFPVSLREQPSSSNGIKPHRATQKGSGFSVRQKVESRHQDHRANSFKPSSEERNVQRES